MQHEEQIVRGVTLKVIREEHQALSAMLRSMLLLVVQHRRSGTPLYFGVLPESAWPVLDRAFAANRDPLTGHPADDVYRPLFSKIVRTAPAPIGLGAAAA